LKKDIKKRFDRELEEKQPLAEGVEPPKRKTNLLKKLLQQEKNHWKKMLKLRKLRRLDSDS
jgi:hypothetical protein